MNEIEFRKWLDETTISNKVKGDVVSRLKTLQREFGNCDFDKEYKKDKCQKMIFALSKKGENDLMKKYGNVKLPIGKFSLNTYKYALRLYVKFKDEQ